MSAGGGTAPWVWMDGRFVPWADARVHVRSDLVMRGGSVFEGIAGYWQEEAAQLRMFRLADHMLRLTRSMKVLRMELRYPLSDVQEAVVALVQRCEFREDVHVRPTVYFGEGASFGYRTDEIAVGAFVTAVPFPHNEKSETGISISVSSWTRISDNSHPPRVKGGANYLSARLAQVQAQVDGYDGAVLLNHQGYVSEGPGACIMIVRDNVLVTPRITDGILESITRATIVQVVRAELGLPVEERAVDRTEMYLADEIFECGTAHEITPIVRVDGYVVGGGVPGPITRRVRELYSGIVHGALPRYRHWLTNVY